MHIIKVCLSFPESEDLLVLAYRKVFFLVFLKYLCRCAAAVSCKSPLFTMERRGNRRREGNRRQETTCCGKHAHHAACVISKNIQGTLLFLLHKQIRKD